MRNGSLDRPTAVSRTITDATRVPSGRAVMNDLPDRPVFPSTRHDRNPNEPLPLLEPERMVNTITTELAVALASSVRDSVNLPLLLLVVTQEAISVNQIELFKRC